MRFIWIGFVLFASVCTLNAADLRITTVTHHSRVLDNRIDDNFKDFDLTETSTTYVHGQMHRYVVERNEKPPRDDGFNPPHTVEIENCETRAWTVLDYPDRKQYVVGRYTPENLAFARAASEKRVQGSRADWETLRMSVETSVVDTGETMKIFGHTARHFIKTSHATPWGEAEVIIGMQEETTLDAWYIDADPKVPRHGCQSEDLLTVERDELDRMTRETRREVLKGPKPQGFIVRSKLVTRISQKPPTLAPAEATYTETIETTVTEFSESPLDPALFEAPAGYKLVTCLRGGPYTGDGCR
jgi:hypothetical protein